MIKCLVKVIWKLLNGWVLQSKWAERNLFYHNYCQSPPESTSRSTATQWDRLNYKNLVKRVISNRENEKFNEESHSIKHVVLIIKILLMLFLTTKVSCHGRDSNTKLSACEAKVLTLRHPRG